MQKITTCLGFDGRAEEALEFYTSVFPDSRIVATSRWGANGRAPEGTLLTATFELDGQELMVINGDASFTFTHGMSLVVHCDTQEEIDRFWEALSEGGAPGPCGWLTDRFGVSWQVVPRILGELVSGDPERSERVMSALLEMGKLEIEGLRRAYERAS